VSVPEEAVEGRTADNNFWNGVNGMALSYLISFS
jgi:hypothetical protein